MVHGNVLLISPLSDTMCIFFSPKLIYSFSTLASESVQDIFAFFPPKCPVLGILALLLFSKSSVDDLLRSMNSCHSHFVYLPQYDAL